MRGKLEIVVKFRHPHFSSLLLHVHIAEDGTASAVHKAIDSKFALRPPADSLENAWVLLARIASEGARAEAAL